MWVFVYSYAEVVALNSIGVGDRVTFSCRDRPGISLRLPPTKDRSAVLIEDSDYGIGPDGEDDSFLEVIGEVGAILVNHDDAWYDIATTSERRSGSEPTGFLIEVQPY
jgi:hypothetical protein